MKTKKFINSEGFTLVELMVVVGIIGILATIAIPNFRKYQAKSKTTEAKIQLSSVYTSLESMLLEYDTYATCLGSAGYNPSEDYATRFYGVGFGGQNTATETTAKGNGLGGCDTGTNGECSGAGCTGSGWFFFRGGKLPAGVTGVIQATGVTSSISADTFSAMAIGKIASSAEDKWVMNNTKKLIHDTIGY